MTDRYKNKYRIASTRLANWDYRWDAAYFITICTKDRQLLFGQITDHVMHLSNAGKIAEQYWAEIPNHFSVAVLHEFVVMPNHIHGIVVIDNSRTNPVAGTSHNTDTVETLQCNVSTLKTIETIQPADGLPGKNEFMSSISPKPGSIATIMRSYKSAVSATVHKTDPNFQWQSRFYDHIIRNEDSFIRIQNYIINNAANWKDDKFFM